MKFNREGESQLEQTEIFGVSYDLYLKGMFSFRIEKGGGKEFGLLLEGENVFMEERNEKAVIIILCMSIHFYFLNSTLNTFMLK